MTTSHPKNRSRAQEGINHLERIVTKNQSIFQKIDGDNDIGNDAYIEFNDPSGRATGLCIAVQVKSGESYRRADGNYSLIADRDHFEYWHSHVLPVAGIVYDPNLDRCFWCDITGFLGADPRRIEAGPFTVPVSIAQVLNIESFRSFYKHFHGYLHQYRGEDFLGRALAEFSQLGVTRRCRDGLEALFTLHRHEMVSWYYLASCLKNFRSHALRFRLISILAHIPGHPDILWHSDNQIPESTRQGAEKIVKEVFGRTELEFLLEALAEGGGFSRGSIGQAAHSIIGLIPRRAALLESIAFDPSLAPDTRYFAVFLAAYETQADSRGAAQELLARYRKAYEHEDDEYIEALCEEIDTEAGLTLYE